MMEKIYNLLNGAEKCNDTYVFRVSNLFSQCDPGSQYIWSYMWLNKERWKKKSYISEKQKHEKFGRILTCDKCEE